MYLTEYVAVDAEEEPAQALGELYKADHPTIEEHEITVA